MSAHLKARRLARLSAIGDTHLRGRRLELAASMAQVSDAAQRVRRIDLLISSATGAEGVSGLAAAAGLRAMLRPAAEAAREQEQAATNRRAEAERIFIAARHRAERLDERHGEARRLAVSESEAREALNLPPSPTSNRKIWQ